MSRSIMAEQSSDRGRRSSLIHVLQRALNGLDSAWWWGESLMREARVLPCPRPALEPLEDVVQGTLRPVEPSDAFRQSLRSDLAFAAHQRGAGLVVERPRPFREGLILGVAFGFLAILGTTLLVALWPRQRAERARP